MVYEKAFDAGTIPLYGNDGKGFGSYFVFVRPRDSHTSVGTGATRANPNPNLTLTLTHTSVGTGATRARTHRAAQIPVPPSSAHRAPLRDSAAAAA